MLEDKRNRLKIKALFFFISLDILTIKNIPKILNINDKYLPISESYEKILNINLRIRLNKNGICSKLWCLVRLSWVVIVGSATQKLKISSNHKLS